MAKETDYYEKRLWLATYIDHGLISEFLKLPQTFTEEELNAAGRTVLLMETIEGKATALGYQGFAAMANTLRDMAGSRAG